MSDRCLRHLNSHDESINTIKFTHDGNFCMTASNDRSVKLWNPHKDDPAKVNQEAALLIKTYSGVHGYNILDVAIFRDNSRFVSAGGDKACFLMDVATGRTIRRIQAHTHIINTIDLNDDGTVLASGSYDQTVALWDLRSSNREPLQVLRDFKDSVTSIVHTDSAIIVGCIDSTLRIYDMRRGLCHADDIQAPVINIKLSSDHKTVLCTCLGGTIKLIDIDSGKWLNEYSGGHINRSFKLESCFASDDQHILTSSEDGSFCHYNILSKAMIRKTDNAHTKSLSSIAYHPKDPCFVTASYDGTAKYWSSHKYSYS